MLIKLADHLRPTNALQKSYIGRVLQTDVGSTNSAGALVQLGRVKCSIQGLIEDITDLTKLPWFYPNPNNMMGGSNVTGSFSVPVVGSYVEIEFPHDDIYAGVYSGSFTDPNTLMGMFNEDYPNSYGWRDEQNTFLKVNKAKKSLELHHASGASMEMDTDSNITFTSRKAVTFKSEDGQTTLTFEMGDGSVGLTPKNGFTVGGPVCTIESSNYILDVDDSNETVKGSKSETIIGGYKQAIGGSYSSTVVGNIAKSNTGNYSEMIALQADYTYGTGKSEDVVLGDVATKLIAGDRTVDILLGDYDISMLLGDYSVDVKAGNISLSTLAGKVDIGNLLAKLSMALSGAIDLKNALGSISISPTGSITIDGPLAIDITAGLAATFAGSVSTTVGGSGITKVDGSLVLLGGGGLPVARLGDQVLGVGNLGAPVVSTIILGSFKVLSG